MPTTEEYLRMMEEQSRATKVETAQPNSYLESMQDYVNGNQVLFNASTNQAVSSNPDEIARQKRIAALLGTPAGAVAGSPDQAKQMAAVKTIDQNTQDTPALRQKYTDLDFAKLAHDESANLSSIERIARNFGAGLGGQFLGSGMEGMGHALKSLERLTNSKSITADWFLKEGKQTKDFWNDVAPKNQGTSDQVVQGLGQVVGQIGLALNPYTAPAAIGLLIGQGSDQMNDKIMKDKQAQKASQFDKDVEILSGGAITAVTEWAATKLMLKTPQALVLKNKLANYMVKIGLGAAEEGVQETLENVGQDVMHIVMTNPDAKIDWNDAAQSGEIGGIVGGIVQGVINGALHIRTRRTQKTFTDLSEASKAQSLRERDPGQYNSFADAVATHLAQTTDGAVENVYVDANTFHQVMKANDIDPAKVAEAMPSIKEQLDQATVTGGDIAIPMNDFIGKMAGTEIGDMLSPHLRSNPEALSMHELTEAQKLSGDFTEAANLIMDKQRERAAFQQSANEVQKTMFDQIKSTGVYSPQASRQYAAFTKNFYTVMADKMGITPMEAYERVPYKVAFGELNGEQEQYPAEYFSQASPAEAPQKTVKAYKLFRTDPKRPGELFPLFVNAKDAVPVGQWVNAEVGPLTENGKVKSKLGPLAYRPGWHSGDLPIATHIGGKSSSSLSKPDYRPDNQVWAEVELPADIDWQEEANLRGTNAKGQVVPVKAHITDQLPKGGHYRYKTNPNMTGNWLISGALKVNRILNDDEVKAINDEAGVADLPRRTAALNQSFAGMSQRAQEIAAALNEGGTVKAEEGSIAPSGVLYSTRTWTQEEKSQLKELAGEMGIEESKVDKWMYDIDNAMARVLADPSLDFIAEAADLYSALKPNSDPHYTVSLDFSTLCRKRYELMATIEAIQNMTGRALTKESWVEVREMLDKMGYNVSCGACYVDSKRMEAGKFINKFIDSHPDEDPKQFLSQAGIDQLKRDNPSLYAEFKKAIGSNNAKTPESRTDYHGEIRWYFLEGREQDMKATQETGKATWSSKRNSARGKKRVEAMNKKSGLRWQSWSDFEVPHLMDAMQAVLDMHMAGLMGHAYTKVPDFVLAMGKTGLMVNMSLIPKGTGLDTNGALVFDTKEGMPFDVALELREKHEMTAGTIAIGVGNEHIRALLADPRIDYVIPYHASGLSKEIAKKFNMDGWEDYTHTQSEDIADFQLFHKMVGKKDKKLVELYKAEMAKKPNQRDFTDYRKAAKTAGLVAIDTTEYWDNTKSGKDNAGAYLELAASRGVAPKFRGREYETGRILADFTQEEGYWKLLIDRKMYDHSGNNIVQEPVKPEYDQAVIDDIYDRASESPAPNAAVPDAVNAMADKLGYKGEPFKVLAQSSVPTTKGDWYYIRDAEGDWERVGPFKSKAEAMAANAGRGGSGKTRKGSYEGEYYIETDSGRDYVVRGDNLKSGGWAGENEVYQSTTKNRRAGYDPSRLTTILTQESDYSSFLHETSHFFLDAYSRIAADENAPARIKEDMQAMLDWFGVESLEAWNSMTLEEQRQHHEAFAYNFEIYMSEGKAPNIKMQGIFQRFAAWLKKVYRDIRGELNDVYRQEHGTDLPILTGEVRQVMDRMLATDDQINHSEQVRNMTPMYQTQQESGMTDEEWAAYQELQTEAHETAVEELTAASIRQMKWLSNAKSKFLKTLQNQVKDIRKAVGQEVAAEVQAEPVYRAIEFIKTGKMDIGENADQATRRTATELGMGSTKLSIEALKQMYGEEANAAWRYMPTGPNGLIATDGVHPDILASLFGFKNGDQMVREILSAKPMKQEISDRTDQRMLEEHGELTDPKAMQEAVDQAVHNEARGRFIAVELRHLSKVNKPVRVMQEAARQAAQSILSNRSIGTVNPRDFMASEARAAAEVEKHMKSGDHAAAIQAKEFQLLQNQLAAESLKLQAELSKTLESWRDLFQSDKKLAGKNDMNYVNVARAILSNYGVGQAKGTPSTYLDKIKKYDPDFYAEIEPMITAHMFEAQPLKDLTVDEFRDLKDQVDSLRHMAKRTKQILVDGKLVDREEAVGDLISAMDELNAKPFTAGQRKAMTKGDEAKLKLMGARAALRRVEAWADAMDRGNPNGPFRTYIWNPISEAVTKYRMAKQDYMQRYLEIVKGIEQDLIGPEVAAPEIGYTFTRQELMHALLHTGNQSNMKKLLVGRGWASLNEDGSVDISNWQQFLERAMTEGIITKKHMDFAQSVWDLLEEMKPAAQKAHYDMYGHYFSEITADQIATPFGDYRGGYVPAITDMRLVPDSAMRNEQETQATDNSYMFPTTGRGFTKGRVEYNKPLLLDLGYLLSHIDKVLRFTHIEPSVKDVARIVKNDKTFGDAMNELDPTIRNDMLVPWLQRTAQQMISMPTKGWGGKAIDSFFTYLRNATGLQMMVGNVVNTLQQFTGLSISTLRANGHMRSALWRYVKQPGEMTDIVLEKSDHMKTHINNEMYEIQQTVESLVNDTSKYEKLRDYTVKHGYFMQAATQNVVDIVTWMAAYDKANTEPNMSEAEAVRLADSAVRMTQGSFAPEDISRFETGGAMTRAFTQFYSYFNMQANLLGTEFLNTTRNMGVRDGAGKLLYVYAYGFMIPALLSEILVEAFSGFDTGDDDEFDAWDALRLFVRSQYRPFLAMVPVAGSAVNAGINMWNEKPYDDRISTSPSVSMVESAVRAPNSVYKAIFEDGSWSRGAKDAMTMIGMMARFPLGQLGKPVGYIMDVNQGKANPESVMDYVRGLVSGRDVNKKQ